MSIPRTSRLVLALSLTALLAACGGGGSRPDTAAKPNHGFILPNQPKSSTSPGTPSPADLADHPDHFKGMAAPDVLATLGQPDYRRREAPAEVWQYYGDGCVLDLFLYDESKTKRVSHVDMRNRNPGQLPDAECLPKLLVGQREQPST